MSEALTTETSSEATESETTEAKVAETLSKASEKSVDPPKTEAKTEAPAFDYTKWADGLTDEGKKDYAKRFKNLDEVIDGALSLRKDISSRIKVPGENATEEDIKAFHKAIGASDNPEDYKVAAPENYELGEAQTALVGLMKQKAAEAGVPVSAFENFTKTYFEAEIAVKEKIEAEVGQYRKDTEARLTKEHGKDYERRLTAGNKLIDKIDQTGEMRSFLDSQITWNGVSMRAGDHPAMLNVMAELGLRMGEDGVLSTSSPDDVKAIDDKIRELERNHPLGARTPEQDRQIQELYRKRYPSG